MHTRTSTHGLLTGKFLDRNKTMVGKGGAGTVYKAKWKKRTVAIKIANPDLQEALYFDEKAYQDYQRYVAIEMSVIDKLIERPHVNVLRFYDYGLHQYTECSLDQGVQLFFHVTEFAKHGDLFDYIASHQPFSWSVSIKIMLGVAKGLAALHAMDIIHSDVKLANILLGRNFTPKLADYDGARFSTTENPGRFGTGHWMAPELLWDAVGGFNTKASDVYGLALVCWAVACWQLKPYSFASDQVGLIRAHVTGERDDIVSDCPKHVAKLINWGWKSNPQQRPTATKVVKGLEKALTI